MQNRCITRLHKTYVTEPILKKDLQLLKQRHMADYYLFPIQHIGQ